MPKTTTNRIKIFAFFRSREVIEIAPLHIPHQGAAGSRRHRFRAVYGAGRHGAYNLSAQVLPTEKEKIMSMSDTKTISIQTKASAFSRADAGFVDLYVKADGMLLADAVAEAKQKTEKVLEAIRKAGEATSVLILDVQTGAAKHFG